jgi:hypothetical protein
MTVPVFLFGNGIKTVKKKGKVSKLEAAAKEKDVAALSESVIPGGLLMVNLMILMPILIFPEMAD